MATEVLFVVTVGIFPVVCICIMLPLDYLTRKGKSFGLRDYAAVC